MDELTITITVEHWLETPDDRREATLRSLGDLLLAHANAIAADLGVAVHSEHDLEY